MKPQSRNLVIAAVALLLAAGALGAIAYGNIGKNLVYYWSPGELIAQGDRAIGPTIRLGGLVQEGSIVWNAAHTHLDFKVADSKEAEAKFVNVSSDEIPPQMFRPNIGVVVEGTFDRSQVFHTTRLMVNHSNEYRPPKPGENTKDWVEKTLLDPQASSKP